MSPTLIKCGIEQLDELEVISRKTFIDAFESQNDPQDFDTYLGKAFAKDQLKSELKNKNSSFYFVYFEKQLAGYFKLNENTSQTDIKAPESLEIERIYVLQSHQGLKLGHWMIEEIKKIAKFKEKAYIWLGVWEDNSGAIRFYEKNGFIKFGRHPYYIGKDKQMDWLMRLDLVNL